MRLIDADLIQYEPMLSAKGNGMYEDVMVAYKSQIDDLPTIEERKTGEWLTSDDLYETGICSCCKQDSQEPVSYAVTNFHYCPNCGAWMEGET